MKKFLRSGSRWFRRAGLALSALPMLLLPAGESPAADAAVSSPRKGFIMDESIAKRMIKYLLFARSHEIWQREIL